MPIINVLKSVEIFTHKDSHRVLIAGTEETAEMILRQIPMEVNFLGLIPARMTADRTDKVYGGVRALKEAILNGDVDEIFWTFPDEFHSLFSYFTDLCKSHMVRLYVVSIKDNSIEKINSVILMKEPLQKAFNKFLKRAFDVVVSFFVIVLVLSWLIPLMALLIKLTSRGPVFFIQERTGLNNKPFKMIKFRSMYVNIESDTKACEKNDARVTPLGNFIRRTSIDELPQFFHTFTGSMSIIGPRPHMVNHTSEYSNLMSSFMIRHFVKPGLSGWAQVNGYRGTIERSDDVLKRIKFDIWYIENWSIWLDIKICFKTLGLMIDTN